MQAIFGVDGRTKVEGEAFWGKVWKFAKSAEWHPEIITEKFVRTFGYFGGRHRAANLFNDGSISALRELSHHLGEARLAAAVQRGSLNETDMDLYGLQMADEVGGSVRPFNQPGWMNTPEGSVVAQFRTIAFDQSTKMRDRIIKPALKGDFVPLMQWAAMVGMTSWGVAYLAGMMQGDDDKKKEVSAAWRMFEFVNMTNALGLVGDFAYSMERGDDWGGTRRVIGTMFGPTGSSMYGLGQNLFLQPFKKGTSQVEGVKATIRTEIPLLGKLAKWEVGPFDILNPEEKSGMGDFKGLGGF